MLQSAFSTNAFTKCSAEEAIASIAEAGYEGVELMLDAPHLFPADATPEKVDSIRKAAAAAGLTFSNANAFPMSAVGDTWNPSWIDPDPEVRTQRIRHTADALRIAGDLGIPNISTEPGGQLSHGMTRARAMEYFRLGLQMVYPLARELEVTVLIEPEPNLLLERVDDFLEFIGTVPHGQVALNFDIGHFYCVGEDPAEQFRVLRQYAKHVHFEDIAASREHRHLLPGAGAIDLPGVVRTCLGSSSEPNEQTLARNCPTNWSLMHPRPGWLGGSGSPLPSRREGSFGERICCS